MKEIEEMIKIIERKIKEAEQYTDITGLCLTLDKELCNAFINILSDYKRVLKEVKRYKNMYEAEYQIHLVRNEQLDRKQKAIIKCNELENENKELKKENEELKIKEFQLHLATEEMKSMIYKQKVKEKIEELEKRKQEYEEENTIDEDYLFDMNGYNSAILVLQELLESED